MSETPKLIISKNNFLYVIDHNQILYCQSDNCYTTIHLLDGKSFILIKSLSKVAREDLKSTSFIRVSQSYIVNKNFVHFVDKKNKKLGLSNDVYVNFTINLKELITLINNSKETIEENSLLMDAS